MSLIIASGSNLSNPHLNLVQAKKILCSKFELIAESKIYVSKAVDNLNQPDFLNQVLEFKIPASTPQEILKELLEIEFQMGRVRNEWRGPRIIDLDLIFWSNLKIKEPNLVIPHPRWLDRSFIVRPLMELPFFQTIEKCFTIPKSFDVEAFPIN
jgi:2-amino-4-hydroxy-6-hydroxymethyldihydropteridine diphosphokinase